MFSEVLGDHWFSPETSKCCYFAGFRWFSEVSCFFMFFRRYLKQRWFHKKQKTCSFYMNSGGSKCCYFVGFSYDSGIDVF